MKVYNYLFLGLLFLIGLSLIFTKPGVGNLENFYNYSLKIPENINLLTNKEVFVKYPPATYFTLNTILIQFKPNPNIKIFSNQTAFLVFKASLFFTYLLTWLTLLYLVRSAKQFNNTSFVDVSIAYFSSVSILLSTVALSFFEIFAAPFVVLTLAFTLQRRFIPAALTYLLSLSFNWTLLVFAPMLFIQSLRTGKLQQFTRIIPLLGFVVIPLAITLLLLHHGTGTQPLLSRITSNIYNIPWLFNYVLFSLFEKGTASYWVNILSQTTSVLFISIFVFFIVRRFIYNRIAINTLLSSMLAGYLAFLLLFPNVSEGNLIWITLVGLLLFLLKKPRFTSLYLLLINLAIFINLFVFFGSAGTPPVRGLYFDAFRVIFALVTVGLIIWQVAMLYKNKFNLAARAASKPVTPWTKITIVTFLVLLNISLIPAQGSPDTVSWTQYALATIEHANPFRAYTEVVLQYPPLSIVIIGFFAQLWKTIVGISQDYAIATKIGIFVFYYLAIVSYLRLKDTLGEKIKMTTLDGLLIILTTFSLIIQTQGLADLNIYVMPSLIASTIALFKRRYFLAGLLLGITVSIKWQPMILIPLFLATVFHFRQSLKTSIAHLVLFLTGFLVVPIIIWTFVLQQPNGWFVTTRAFEFFLEGKGAFMLSGQALNVNWIVTYILHFLQTPGVESLEHLGGLNRQIPIDLAPTIFQGYLFLVVFVVIILRFWLSQKKNPVNFLSASLMVFFSHFILNRTAYEKHLFYTTALMLPLFLLRPTIGNRKLLILFDVMTVMNLAFFYGITGQQAIPRLFLGFDITVLFAAYYVIIYLWVLWRYLRGGLLFDKGKI